ncbi:MAG: mannitol dehydrogenase family protein [Henriciella sp.]|uniref:mannitol dehydrogenase family protein n=1 Tax=Henriciella sp. TaxID=1968823 RepID=UPI003C749684
MTARLCADNLGALPGEVGVPAYDRASTVSSVVHLGVGNFHRGHQAVYFDDLLSRGHKDWAICGASLRRETAAQQLNPQNGLFTLVEQEGDGQTDRVIGSIQSVITAPQDPARLVRELCSPATQLITLTITEKGYCLDLSTGSLNASDRDIQHDLANIHAPKTAIGFLVSALGTRWTQRLGGVTILSCDNLPENGLRTRDAVLSFAREIDPDLASWIAEETRFPSSMVDRIVPATTPEDVDALEARIGGLRDEAMIKTEPFRQWVVEDDFASDRPPLEEVGVQMTSDVAAWEQIKLRLLNGSHSAMAYLGGLAGHPYVHEVIAEPHFVRLIDRLWAEAAETLRPVSGFDLAAYVRSLKDRFANAALRHKTHQIAMDGSQKLPQRLLEPLRIRTEAGQASPALLMAVAGWMRWQAGVDDGGRAFEVDDPLAGATQPIAKRLWRDPDAMVRAMLELQQIFPAWLRENDNLVGSLTSAYGDLVEKGVRGALEQS